jgi:hypothetical protein
MSKFPIEKLKDLKHELRTLGLFVPDRFWGMTDVELSEKGGGCGPGKAGDKLVPDTFYGLSMTPACFLHDVAYGQGQTWQDKFKADVSLMVNCTIIIFNHYKAGPQGWRHKAVAVARCYRAMTYFNAVAFGGGGAFKKANARFDAA